MKIINAVDGSPHSDFATDLLSRLPFPKSTDVTALSIVEALQLGGFSRLLEEHIDEAVQQQRQKLTEDILQQASEKLSARFDSVSTKQTHGHIADQIITEAEAGGADLIVLGIRGHNAVERFFLGSTSEKVAKYAPCSVLLGHPKVESAPPAAPEKLRILVTCDSSPASLESVNALCRMSLDPSIEIQLLTVHTTVSAFRQDIIQKTSELWRREQEEAQKTLDEAASNLKQAGAGDVLVRLTEANEVSTEILSVAEHWAADMVMVGSTGKGRVDRFLLGSVSKRLTRHAPCSAWVSRETASES